MKAVNIEQEFNLRGEKWCRLVFKTPDYRKVVRCFHNGTDVSGKEFDGARHECVRLMREAEV